MNQRRKALARLAGGIGAAWAPRMALAQELPDRVVKLIVPFAAGGGVDALARPFAVELGRVLRRTVTVDNRPSNTGQIGAAEVAKSAPDGTTLLISSAAFGTTPSFVPGLPYDIFKDFDPIAILAATPQILVAPTGFKAGTLAEVLQMARAQGNAGAINFALPGSSGIQRLATELLTTMAQVNVAKIPYKGAGAVFPDLIAGRVDLMFDNPGSSMVHVNSGRLKVLASTGAARLSILPNVPTVAEILPGFEALNWFILAARAGTPAPLVERLNDASRQAMKSEAMRIALDRDGLSVVAGTTAQAREFLRSEFTKWDKVIRDKKLTAD